MKYSPKVYAKSFCEVALRAKSQKEIDRYINNLLSLVETSRDQRGLKDIYSAIEKIVIQKTNSRKLVIESARPLNDENEKKLKLFIKPSDRVEKVISKQLIAGIKVTINDELQLDNSFSRKIKNLLNI